MEGSYEVTVHREVFNIVSFLSKPFFYQMKELHLNSKLHTYMERWIFNDV